MLDLVPILSTVLPIIASTLLIIVITINLYLKIRRQFPISVNCWFCNSWTKVRYDDRNSFDCPTCLQYNGFDKDGDYNKIIPEQHDELMNTSTRVKSKKSTVANGLCVLCNNNQQLKMFQLAHFVPLNEENYDAEIEHFQEQLEKAYKLCKKCDRVLKKTLDKQNAWIFGNRLKNMCSNGISKIADQIKKETKLSIASKVNGVLTMFLVFLVILTTMSSMKLLTKTLATYVPPTYLGLYNFVISAINSSKVVQLNVPPYFTRSIKIESYTVISSIGLILQTIKIIGGRKRTAITINHLLCWVILFLISWVRFSRNFSSYILFVEAFCCVYLFFTAFNKDDHHHTPKTAGKTMRKIVKNLEYTCTDFSESSDFENISGSSKNSGSRDSSYSTLDVPLHFNTARNVLNSSFVSAKSSMTKHDLDLNKSLNNLHLGGLNFKPPNASSIASFAVKRPKPVLSPPKLQTVNSWVAGGFWRDADGVVLRTNLSRSSSESSGFGSQHNEMFVAPKSNFGDFDKLSMHSEPLRLSPSPTYPFPPTDWRRSVFSPSLQQNLVVQRVGSPLIRGFENWSDKVNSQAMQSFRDLSLRSN